MKININTEAIKKTVCDICSDNREVIVSAIGSAVLIGICKIAKVPINISPRYPRGKAYTSADFTTNLFCHNNIETAIASIMDGAANFDFDRSRKDAADRITRIVLRDNDAEEDTINFAISALSKLAKDMDFDSSRNYIYELIETLAKKGEN